jgi:hypothetical protein
MEGNDPKAEDRRRFAKRFARPRGLSRPAGDIIAESVIELARKRKERAWKSSEIRSVPARASR